MRQRGQSNLSHARGIGFFLLAFASVLLVAAPAAASRPQADIVFIVDESGSTDDEIADVRANVSQVASSVSAEIDGRYALVVFGGAPPDGPVNEPFVRTDFTDPEGLTRALERSGAYPSPTGEEMGFYATTYAFTTLTGFRPRAGACAILVSDEPPAFKRDRASDLAGALAALGRRNASWFGIVDTTDRYVRRDYGPDPGSLAQLTDGAVFSLRSFRSDAPEILRTVLSRCARSVTQPSPCTITGTARADVLRGTSSRDVICALGGNDVVYARGGNDVVYAGGGKNTVYGGAGNDYLVGGRASEALFGGRGHDEILARAGRDRLSGGRGRDGIRGGHGADTMFARDGWRDIVRGGPGADNARVDARLDRVSRVEEVRAR